MHVRHFSLLAWHAATDYSLYLPTLIMTILRDYVTVVTTLDMLLYCLYHILIYIEYIAPALEDIAQTLDYLLQHLTILPKHVSLLLHIIYLMICKMYNKIL